MKLIISALQVSSLMKIHDRYNNNLNNVCSYSTCRISSYQLAITYSQEFLILANFLLHSITHMHTPTCAYTYMHTHTDMHVYIATHVHTYSYIATVHSYMHAEPIILFQEQLGQWDLCFKFLSLFYSEFLLKSLHYAQFYFYATDSIIILYLASYS